MKMSASNLLLIVAGVLLVIILCSAQNFEPGLSDKAYLDKIQEQLHEEIIVAHSNLINQTKILQQVTRSFIASKIKENLFRAIRAEVEMTNSTNSTTYSRQSRQDEDGDDDGDDDGDSATTARPPPPGLLQQLANVVTAIFGPNVNVTEYVHSATAFLPRPVSDQLVDVVKLIDPARFTSTTSPAPTQFVILNPQYVQAQAVQVNGTPAAYTQKPPLTNNNQGGSQTPGVVQQSNAAEISRNPPSSSGISSINNSPGLQVFPTTPATTSTTEEDEDDDGFKGAAAVKNTQDEEFSGEPNDDELGDDILSDDKKPSGGQTLGNLEDYAAVKYALNLYKRLTRNEIPTTTEFMNTTTALPEYEDEVDKRATTAKTSTRYQMLVQSGYYLYEGAREAYQLLQHINRYLDRVNVQFENAGFGAEEVGVDV